MISRIAWRNIWRSPLRSLVIIGSISLGIWAALFLTAFYNGMITQRIESAIATELSHVQIHHPEFADEADPKYIIPDGSYFLHALQVNDSVKAVTARIVLQGMAGTASGSAGVTIRGIIPEQEKKVTNLYTMTSEGNYLSDSAMNQVYVGARLFRKLNLKGGGKLILTVNNSNGDIASAAFRVVGVYACVNTPYEESNVFIHFNDASDLGGMDSAINELALILKSDKMVSGFRTSLQRGWKQLQIQDWTELNPEMRFLVSSFDRMILVYMSIVVVALAFGIVNTMMMAVLERTREIGILLSLGMNRSRIFLMVLMETVWMVLAGCPLGLAASFLTIAIAGKKGINMDMFADLMSSFGYSNRIFPSLTAGQVFTMIALVVGTALISALFPARRALSLKPAEAIRQ